MKISISMQALLQKMAESGHGLPDHLFFVQRTPEEKVKEDERSLVVEWAIIYTIIGYSPKRISAYKTQARVIWRGEYLVSEPDILQNASVNRVEIDIKENRFLSWPRRPGLRKASRH